MNSAYNDQLNTKINTLSKSLAPFFKQPVEIYPSPPEHYRMRAEFKIWHDHEAGICHYAMFEPGSNRKAYTIEQFGAASLSINQMMPKLLEAINAEPILRRKLFQIEFLSSTQGELLVSLIYHTALNEAWQEKAELLAKHCTINLIGRARGLKRQIGKDYVTQRFSVNGREFTYRHSENSFTQPNAPVCEQMLAWADRHAGIIVGSQGDDLLELYCGNGNFTLPLSQHFRKVLANEIAKTSVADAQINMAYNNIENITLARMSSEELTQALNGVRAFRRLEGITLTDYSFGCVFVDPPRAGLDTATLEFISQFPFIIYISCNHHTLSENLQQLSQSHSVTEAALFDQFPFTDHIEVGVVLKRRA
ncbi:MAG TPA: tRNA (uridine(54)-C5)-methyltransferase TrmA [Cellvibrionaceae bacterium]